MEAEFTGKLPDPDFEGRYKFGDGSEITFCKTTRFWIAWQCDGSPLRDDDSLIRYFLYPSAAATELWNQGAAREIPAVPYKEIHHTLRVEGGEPIEVYASHYGPDTRLAELNFVTASIQFSIHGVQPKELRSLARLIRDFARELKEENE